MKPFSMRLTILVAVCLAATAFTLVSCRGGSGSNRSFIVRSENVNSGGCLNLALLFGRMRTFPETAAARRVSTDIQVSGSDGTRDSFLTFLTRTTFRFEEKPWEELRDFYAATQSDCSTTVTLINEERDQEEFKIKQAGPDFLSIANDAGKTYSFKLLSPTDMQLIMSYPAEDPCNSEIISNVTTTEVIHWGDPNDVFNRPDETVSADMLRALSRSTDSLPAGIADIVSSNSSGQVKVSAKALRQLRDSDVRIDVMACLPPFPTPIPPPAEASNNPDASPTPSPTPADPATAARNRLRNRPHPRY